MTDARRARTKMRPIFSWFGARDKHKQQATSNKQPATNNTQDARRKTQQQQQQQQQHAKVAGPDYAKQPK